MREIRPIYWDGARLHLLDQTKLPADEETLVVSSYEQAVDAIRGMQVRGAPAIGVTAAYAMAMAARDIAEHNAKDFDGLLDEASTKIRAARPTAVNLGWAVDRMQQVVSGGGSPEEVARRLVQEAQEIQREDEAINRRMGDFGRDLMPDGGSVLTHCNTGALATSGFGTALGVIRAGWEAGKAIRGLQHRDTALAARCSFDLLGVPKAGHTGYLAGGLGGRHVDEARKDWLRNHRRRPHCRKR